MKESLALLLVRACVHVYVVGGCGPGVPGPVGDCWLPVGRGPRWAGVGGTRRMGVTVTVGGVGIALLPRLHRGNRPLPTKSLLIVCQVTPRPGLPWFRIRAAAAAGSGLSCGTGRATGGGDSESGSDCRMFRRPAGYRSSS